MRAAWFALVLSACTNDYDRFSIGAGGADATTSTSAATGTGGSSTTTAGTASTGSASTGSASTGSATTSSATTSSATTSAGGGTTGTSAGGGGTGSGGASTTTGVGGQGGAGGGGPCMDVDGSCEPWWDTAWTMRRRLKIDTSGVTEVLADFPVLVRLDDTRIDYAAMLANGNDLRFVTEDGSTVLAHDVELWRDATDQSAVWVRLPSVPLAANGPVTIWMYYGHTGAGAPGPATATWSGGFTSVQHLNGGFTDATGSGHNGAAANPPTATTGLVAGGMNFDGVNDNIVLASEGDYDFVSSLTVSAWIDVDTMTKNWQAIVAKGDTSWRMHRHNFESKLDFGTSHPSAPNDNYGGTSDISVGGWHHVAMTYDGQVKTVYVDGLAEASKAFTLPMLTNNLGVCIGENNGATGRHFDGQIDEVRISPLGRPASWIRLEHRTVTDANMIAFSAEQTP